MSTRPQYRLHSSRTRITCAIVTTVILGLLWLGRSASFSPVTQAAPLDVKTGPRLQLDIADFATGRAMAARFSINVDGRKFFPKQLDRHGLRFVSVHESKKQTYVVTYTRGTGTVEIDLPVDAKKVTVHAAKGFEYLPQSASADIKNETAHVTLKLKRWTNSLERGWSAADEHVHYDRLTRTGDVDWLTMLDGDGLEHAHFMVLKGGKVPGIWARQFGYGKAGEANDGKRWIRSGEEYRDSAQGHINLLGLDKVIQPISTGGMGTPPVYENFPPLFDVMQQTRKLNGFAGVAHGGSLGREPTAICDAVLDGVDFFEITNAHLYSLGLWYELMNCGYNIPPAAGTDLPNYPFRDRWQPFLGSMWMYVKLDGATDFPTWKKAVAKGRVFITSGPLISLKVDDAEPGGEVRLPAGGGDVTIDATLNGPMSLRELEIIRNGQVENISINKQKTGKVNRWRIRQRVRITKSCWLAARG